MSEKDKNDAEGQTITIDLAGLKEALIANQTEQFKLLKEALQPSQKGGRGLLMSAEKSEKLIESLHKCRADNWKLAEQWTVAIPNYRTKETAAGLRDFVWVSEILQGEPGDTANIPYVKDADFQQLSSVGDAFSGETTGLVSSVSTTLYEAGLWSDIAYETIEKFDQNCLDELNSMLANAATRSEDAKIMALIEAGTSTNFAGSVDRKTATLYFYSSNITAALGYLLAAGKNVKPSQCVLYMTPMAYKALLDELCASQVIAHADPKIITTGMIEQLFGVSIVVGGYRTTQQRTNAATGTCDLCFMIRGKRAVALAPKRDLLIETDKQIATRKLRIAASHTFGIKILDFKEIVRIWTSRVA
jgi:hypothetical protein